ncbi:hypothetical protein EMIHUDRAFT_108091 [Emiliania huxleyi CCMP1516]|uniref:Uncharacterized protein n=2 Tax=Emiliania huxleyi TaxID=2903 RepID=A0A0D3HXG5_EMIH1|nr:hypothetical protein EMIHUDRAFT_108091 [Emiliania huxleyi CCMP1516]EOD03700.1 hypothetical protein EMIHUDRAFT_108091 [Emiliania huxleyi CCMP1516]|eukprot:XP_005756129.1 hypothetical protein EMIHUDRAFT_108091 [Emiliania huxleyi CCMP1516]
MQPLYRRAAIDPPDFALVAEAVSGDGKPTRSPPRSPPRVASIPEDAELIESNGPKAWLTASGPPSPSPARAASHSRLCTEAGIQSSLGHAAAPPSPRTASYTKLCKEARAESARGHHAKADVLLRRAIELQQANPLAWGDLAEVRLASGDCLGAFASFVACAERCPVASPPWAASVCGAFQARKQAMKGCGECSLGTCTACKLRLPPLPAWMATPECLRQTSEDVVEADPDSIVAWRLHSEAHAGVGDHATAEKSYCKAVQIVSDGSFDRVLTEQSKPHLAQLDTEVLSRAGSIRYLDLCERGQSQSRRSGYAAAAELFERATELAPAIPLGWGDLGNARAALGEFSAAADAFVTAAQCCDPESQAWASCAASAYTARKLAAPCGSQDVFCKCHACASLPPLPDWLSSPAALRDTADRAAAADLRLGAARLMQEDAVSMAGATSVWVEICERAAHLVRRMLEVVSG